MMNLSELASIATIISCAVSCITLFFTFKINTEVKNINNSKSNQSKNSVSGFNNKSEINQSINNEGNNNDR